MKQKHQLIGILTGTNSKVSSSTLGYGVLYFGENQSARDWWRGVEVRFANTEPSAESPGLVPAAE